MLKIDSPLKDLYGLRVGEKGIENSQIANLPMSNRLKNCLFHYGVFDIESLLEKDFVTLIHSRGFGNNCLEELHKYLNGFAEEQITLVDLQNQLKMRKKTASFNERIDTKEVVAKIGASQKLYEIYNLEPKQYVDVVITDGLFSTRLSNAIKKLGVYTVGDLLELDLLRFSHMPGVGRTSTEELDKFVQQLSLESNDSKDTELYQEIINKFVVDYGNKNIVPWVKEFDVVKKTSISDEIIASRGKEFVDKYLLANRSMKVLVSFIEWVNEDLTAKFDEYIDSLPDKWMNVLNLRAVGRTLEECGQHLCLTRERVRQIEKKASNSLLSWINLNRFIEKVFLHEDYEVIPVDELQKYSKYHSNVFKYALTSNRLSKCAYLEKYNIVSREERNLKQIEAYLNSLPRIISANQRAEIVLTIMEYGCSCQTANRILSALFREGNKYSCRIGVQLNEKYDFVLLKHFEHGIHVYDSEEIAKFKRFVFEDFGEDISDKSDRAIVGTLTRIGFLVGRGMYTSENNVIQLSDKLALEIKTYIDNSDAPIFMTNTIFSLFEDRLMSEGINNKYHLQTTLRKRYNDDWLFRRDYISKDESYTNIYSSVIEYIASSNIPISKDELFKKFYGVPEMVLNFATADSEVINLFGEYIHGSKLKISEKNVEYIRSKILNRMEKSAFCNLATVYDEIDSEYPELLTNNFVRFSFSFFSLVQYLFEDEFVYARPYIGMKNTEITKPEEVALKLLSNEDVFDIDELFDFLKNEGAKINSQLEFINSLNDTHLLINNQKVASIKYIGVSKELVENLENVIVQELNGTMSIDQLQCLKVLSPVNVEWNAWLIYSALKKWGTKVTVGTSDSQFRLAVPLISKLDDYDDSKVVVNSKQRSGSISTISDLDNIDDLLEDISLDEI